MTDALSHLLPSELRTRIEQLSAIALPDDASFEVLTRVADQRLELVDTLDEALALAPTLASGVTHAADGTPSPPSQDDTWGPAGTEDAIIPLRAQAQQIVAHLDPSAGVVTRGARITARMTVEGVAILWVVELGAAVNVNGGLEASITFLRARHLVEINVPTELPRMRVRPEGLADGVLKLLSLSHELELGDESFDRLCFVEGDPAFAPQLLVENVRSRLVARVKCGAFRFALDGGVASLSWTRSGLSLIASEDVTASVLVVAALRQAATNVKLLRDA